jgi:hypothetical protein
MHQWFMEIVKIKLMTFEHLLMVYLLFFNLLKLFSIINIGQLKSTDHSLPPQTSTGKEGSSCRDAQIGRACFLCGMFAVLNTNFIIFF